MPAANREALTPLNAQLTHLTPAILGDKPDQTICMRGENAVKLDALARNLDGDLYVFAVNYDQALRKTPATVAANGLPAGTKVIVVDDDGTVTSEKGFFVDVSELLAVRMYRITSAG